MLMDKKRYPDFGIRRVRRTGEIVLTYTRPATLGLRNRGPWRITSEGLGASTLGDGFFTNSYFSDGARAAFNALDYDPVYPAPEQERTYFVGSIQYVGPDGISAPREFKVYYIGIDGRIRSANTPFLSTLKEAQFEAQRLSQEP